MLAYVYILSTEGLQGCYSDGSGSHKKLCDYSPRVHLLCYCTATLVSLVGVLVIGDAFNQRIIWNHLFNKCNSFCAVCSQLWSRGKTETSVRLTIKKKDFHIYKVRKLHANVFT